MEGIAAPTPSYTQGFILDVLIEMLDELRKARSMTDVNLAAGRAWQSVEPYLLESRWPLVLDLAAEGPDELGQVIDLPV